MEQPAAPGELRHRITIEQITGYTRNVYNEQTAQYATLVPRWAKIEPKRSEGLSLLQANTRAQIQHVTITIRYCPQLTVNNRIRIASDGLSYPTMTDEQFYSFTSTEYATLESVAPSLFYRIDGISDPDETRKWHVIEAVEVTA